MSFVHSSNPELVTHRLLADEVYTCSWRSLPVFDSGLFSRESPPIGFSYVGRALNRFFEMSLPRDQGEFFEMPGRQAHILTGRSASVNLLLDCADVPAQVSGYIRVYQGWLQPITVIVAVHDREQGERYWYFPKCSRVLCFGLCEGDKGMPFSLDLTPVNLVDGRQILAEWRRVANPVF